MLIMVMVMVMMRMVIIMTMIMMFMMMMNILIKRLLYKVAVWTGVGMASNSLAPPVIPP